jgi:pimeloyl-ACP methyl ester carboxylesterase
MHIRLLLVLNVLAHCYCLRAQDLVPYGDNAAAGHYLPTRGFRIYYESYGKGEPLVLFHTNGGSIKLFDNQIPYFSQYYHVIAVDSRAKGRSADPGDSLTFEQMADDFNALLDSLHLDSCYVLGWSDGAISGLLLSIRHPEKVKKLVAVGANLWPDTTGLVPYVFHHIEEEVAALRLQPQTPATKNRLKILELDLKEPHMTLDQLHSIHCPVFVIGGDHDAIPPLHTLQIAANIPSSYLWIVPNSGHSSPVYKKDLFNPQVQYFLSHPFRKIEGAGVFQ